MPHGRYVAISCMLLVLLGIGATVVYVAPRTADGGSSSKIGDITPASPAVLQASLRAADLAAAAYSSTFMPDTEASDVNTDAETDKQFKARLSEYLDAQGAITVGFVDRSSLSFAAVRYLHAFVAATPAEAAGAAGVIDVVFRGTDGSTISVGTDLESRQTPLLRTPGAAVHSGFYLSLVEKPGLVYDSTVVKTSAYEDIKALIETAQAIAGVGADAAINLIGHSLGAAQAALAAYLLTAFDGYSDITLYTFGMPQAGNKAWRTAFNTQMASKHIRWWNMQDHVPQIPNSKVDPGVIFGSQAWYTTDTLHRIDSVAGQVRCGIPSGSYSVCDERSTSGSPANEQSCFVDISIVAALDSADHQIGSYRDHLTACLGQAPSSVAAS